MACPLLLLAGLTTQALDELVIRYGVCTGFHLVLTAVLSCTYMLADLAGSLKPITLSSGTVVGPQSG